ncbi:hypothetical protein BS50DRAFT_578502 [Corynespora cassiicola Philippines]|uniref:Uncharacterized protein n=1 Tax=Corynespora cassiicola Philippines TaxID=1448308 RepID=A0A2T2N7T3_CORCC|nr:hypothetical protein BS50DRAFT_578502 [Corynespora cassiicola Philippines]
MESPPAQQPVQQPAKKKTEAQPPAVTPSKKWARESASPPATAPKKRRVASPDPEVENLRDFIYYINGNYKGTRMRNMPISQTEWTKSNIDLPHDRHRELAAAIAQFDKDALDRNPLEEYKYLRMDWWKFDGKLYTDINDSDLNWLLSRELKSEKPKAHKHLTFMYCARQTKSPGHFRTHDFNPCWCCDQ